MYAPPPVPDLSNNLLSIYLSLNIIYPPIIYYLLSINQQIIYDLSIMYLFCFLCMYVYVPFIYCIYKVCIYILSSISVYNLCSYVSTFLSICQSIFLYPTSFLLFSFLCHFPTPQLSQPIESALQISGPSTGICEVLRVRGDNTMGTLWGLPVDTCHWLSPAPLVVLCCCWLEGVVGVQGKQSWCDSPPCYQLAALRTRPWI